MGGVRQPDRGGVQAANNGGRELISGTTAIESGIRGVTQGDPLSPTIFNVVVDAVVRNWLEGLQAAKEEKDAEGGGGISPR